MTAVWSFAAKEACGIHEVDHPADGFFIPLDLNTEPVLCFDHFELTNYLFHVVLRVSRTEYLYVHSGSGH